MPTQQQPPMPTPPRKAKSTSRRVSAEEAVKIVGGQQGGWKTWTTGNRNGQNK